VPDEGVLRAPWVTFGDHDADKTRPLPTFVWRPSGHRNYSHPFFLMVLVVTRSSIFGSSFQAHIARSFSDILSPKTNDIRRKLKQILGLCNNPRDTVSAEPDLCLRGW
jgi:hypothetical protein